MVHCTYQDVLRCDRLEFPNFDEVKPQSLKIVIIVANCADPYEMLHSAEIHLGLHCLLKYL